jgi:hypothetical protein
LDELTEDHSMKSLARRRQELIERTTSALLRILIDELRGLNRPE